MAIEILSCDVVGSAMLRATFRRLPNGAPVQMDMTPKQLGTSWRTILSSYTTFRTEALNAISAVYTDAVTNPGALDDQINAAEAAKKQCVELDALIAAKKAELAALK